MAIFDAILKKAIQGRLLFMGIDWAKIDALSFSKDDRRVDLILELEGQDAPVMAVVNYSVEGEELYLEKVEMNMRWMTEVAQMVVASKGGKIKVELPATVKGMVLKAIA